MVVVLVVLLLLLLLLVKMVHPGNEFAAAGNRPNPITAFALKGSPTLAFPQYGHPMSRWNTGKDDLTYVGVLGEVVDFAGLPASTQSESMGARVGATTQSDGDDGGGGAKYGYEVCGSPGEVANDPSLGNRYMAYMSDGQSQPGDAYQEVLDGSVHSQGKAQAQVWINVVLSAHGE